MKILSEIDVKCLIALKYQKSFCLAAGIDDIQVKYKNNGELSEVFYYKKVESNEKEAEKETGQSGAKEIQVPYFGVKQKRKYRKPKIQPKVSTCQGQANATAKFQREIFQKV